jgi:hypothetical protein
MTPGRPAVQLADQNWATSQAARATIASFTAAVRAAQIVVGLQEEALTGTRTVLDVLVDEQQLFTTQAQLVTAERDTSIAEFNVALDRRLSVASPKGIVTKYLADADGRIPENSAAKLPERNFQDMLENRLPG